MTRYEAHITKNWQQHGMAHVVVARISSDGSAAIGVFLLDVLCLGVKDAIYTPDVPASELEEAIAARLQEGQSERIHPTCAKSLVEGAVAYAEALGFAPHRDYRKARRVLSGLDAEMCPTDFVFGRDGRPCFIQGPHDTEERIDRVLAVLKARCGPDGFDYELVGGVEADDDDHGDDDDIQAMRQSLIDWLDAEPPDVPRFYQLSGMVVALHLCPGVATPTGLLEVLWDESEPGWSNEDELRTLTGLMTEYWNYVGCLVADAIQPDAPADARVMDVWQEDVPGESGFPMTAACVEWAIGFMRTTELWPEAWASALMRPELAPHWEIVRWWAHFTEDNNKDRIADAAEAAVPRTINHSAIALARALRSERPSPGSVTQ